MHGGGGPAQFAVLTVSFREGKQGEGRDVNWRGLATAVSLCFLFVRTERSYGSKVDN